MIAMYRHITTNKSLYGFVCIIIATLGLSLKAIFIKLIYQYDPSIDAVSVLFLRFLVALPFFIMLLATSNIKNKVRPFEISNIALFSLFGVAGFYLSAILDFSALTYISAGIERLVLFLYPTFVVIISSFIRPKEINRVVFVALATSYIGIVIVFMDQISTINTDVIIGVTLVLGAAIVFAIYTVASVNPIKRYGSIQFIVGAMIAATAASSIHALSMHGLGVVNQTFHVYVLVFPMAIFCTVLPLIMMAEGIKHIGASNASIISSSGPILTLAIAFVVLGENMSRFQLIGAVLIVASIYFISREQSKS